MSQVKSEGARRLEAAVPSSDSLVTDDWGSVHPWPSTGLHPLEYLWIFLVSCPPVADIFGGVRGIVSAQAFKSCVYGGADPLLHENRPVSFSSYICSRWKAPLPSRDWLPLCMPT